MKSSIRVYRSIYSFFQNEILMNPSPHPPKKVVLTQKTGQTVFVWCGKDCHKEGGLAKLVLSCKLRSNKRITIRQAFTSSISEAIPDWACQIPSEWSRLCRWFVRGITMQVRCSRRLDPNTPEVMKNLLIPVNFTLENFGIFIDF